MSASPSHPLSVSELQECLRQRRPVDMSRLDRILRLDRDRSLVEVQAGVSWKALADRLRPGDARTRELPTPCATVGQSIAWNAAGPDGRPTVTHVESLALVTPDGQLRRVDRLVNPQLFALVVGGQGLFGAVYSATLRLQSLSQTISEAQPGSAATPAAEARAMELLVPPEQAQQLELDMRAACREWRTAAELLPPRRIRPEEETVLRWARREYVALTVLLGEPDTVGRAVRAAQLRRELIDAAIERGGIFPIACTPEATRAQTERCYPQLPAFLSEQRRIDPAGAMANAWLRHQRSLLAGA